MSSGFGGDRDRFGISAGMAAGFKVVENYKDSRDRLEDRTMRKDAQAAAEAAQGEIATLRGVAQAQVTDYQKLRKEAIDKPGTVPKEKLNLSSQAASEAAWGVLQQEAGVYAKHGAKLAGNPHGEKWYNSSMQALVPRIQQSIAMQDRRGQAAMQDTRLEGERKKALDVTAAAGAEERKTAGVRIRGQQDLAKLQGTITTEHIKERGGIQRFLQEFDLENKKDVAELQQVGSNWRAQLGADTQTEIAQEANELTGRLAKNANELKREMQKLAIDGEWQRLEATLEAAEERQIRGIGSEKDLAQLRLQAQRSNLELQIEADEATQERGIEAGTAARAQEGEIAADAAGELRSHQRNMLRATGTQLKNLERLKQEGRENMQAADIKAGEKALTMKIDAAREAEGTKFGRELTLWELERQGAIDADERKLHSAMVLRDTDKLTQLEAVSATVESIAVAEQLGVDQEVMDQLFAPYLPPGVSVSQLRGKFEHLEDGLRQRRSVLESKIKRKQKQLEENPNARAQKLLDLYKRQAQEIDEMEDIRELRAVEAKAWSDSADAGDYGAYVGSLAREFGDLFVNTYMIGTYKFLGGVVGVGGDSGEAEAKE